MKMSKRDVIYEKNSFVLFLPSRKPLLKSSAYIGALPLIITFFTEIQLSPLHFTINILLFLSYIITPVNIKSFQPIHKISHVLMF